jgi:hypothetical protein
MKAKLKETEQNLAAAQDTVRVVKNKNGELESVRLALLSDKGGLKKLSDSLAIEVGKEKGKVKYIEKILLQYRVDTLRIQNTVSGDTIKWHYDRVDSGGSRHLAGQSTPALTLITRDEWSLNLITGLKERSDKKLEIFVRSKNPNISFGNIEGAVIDPFQPIVKPPAKYFSAGPCVSVIMDPTGVVRYGIGIGCQWSLFKF